MTWGSFLVTVGIYLVFVFTSNWNPHPAWWLGTTTFIVAAAFYSLWSGMRAIWRGPNRATQAAFLMLTWTPLVLFGCLLWSVIDMAHKRQNIQLPLPTRTLGIWIGNFFEWESMARTPRRTGGKYVTLHDNGRTPNVEKMVSEMDDQIKEMARILGTEPSSTPTSWVRGSLGGQTGRAIGKWAICQVEGDLGEITSLDRHEVAHTMITLLSSSSTQNPPMLFAEGWAEAISRDNNELISSLHTNETAYRDRELEKLIEPEMYGRSLGPMYTHGGPFVIYLIRKFGGPKFLELYRNVRQPTFREDIKRMTGQSFAELESSFWLWLDKENKRIDEKNRDHKRIKNRFSFNTPELENIWLKIIESARVYAAQHPTPTSLGLKINTQWDESAGIENLEFRLVLQNDQCWSLTDSKDSVRHTWISGSEYRSVELNKSSNKSDFVRESEPFGIHSELQFARESLSTRHRLNRFFGYDITQAELRTPPPWQIQIQDIQDVEHETRVSLTMNSSPSRRTHYELVLDPQHGYRVNRAKSNESGESQESEINLEYRFSPQFGGSFISRSVIQSNKYKRTSDYTELSPAEVDALIQEVESVLEKFTRKETPDDPTPAPNSTKNQLPRLTFFIWLTTIAALFLVDWIANRWNLVQKKRASRT